MNRRLRYYSTIAVVVFAALIELGGKVFNGGKVF